MAETKIPEATYTKDQPASTQAIPVDSLSDGCLVKVSCEKWPFDPKNQIPMVWINVWADFGQGEVLFRRARAFSGGVDKYGKDGEAVPATFASIESTWPGEADRDGNRIEIKPISLRIELEPIEDVVTEITIDPSLIATADVVGEIIP